MWTLFAHNYHIFRSLYLSNLKCFKTILQQNSKLTYQSSKAKFSKGLCDNDRNTET